MDGLRTAVERRMVADVPVGVLLSGGIDSSIVVALLAEQGQHGLSTFSIGFDSVGDESGDEYFYSDLIAKTFDTEHHRIHIDSSRLLPAVPKTIAAMSEPMVSHDCVAFYLLSEEVSKSVKVVQSGQGRRRDPCRIRLVPAAGERGAGARPPRPTRRFSSTATTPTCWRSSRPNTGLAAEDPSREFVIGASVRARRRDGGRRRTAAGHSGDAGRRPGEAGRHHDDGLGPGGQGAVPRPRLRRTCPPPVPAELKAGLRRQRCI